MQRQPIEQQQRLNGPTYRLANPRPVAIVADDPFSSSFSSSCPILASLRDSPSKSVFYSGNSRANPFFRSLTPVCINLTSKNIAKAVKILEYSVTRLTFHVIVIFLHFNCHLLSIYIFLSIVQLLSSVKDYKITKFYSLFNEKKTSRIRNNCKDIMSS